MSRGLYSDPFLKALISKKSKLAEEFFETIANSNFVGEDEIVSCLEVPGWVLEKEAIKACLNPNLPPNKFEELLRDQQTLSDNFWSIFKYPNFSKSQIQKLAKNEDVNVRGLALAHEYGNKAELLSFIKEQISIDNYRCYVIISICQEIELDDEVFNYLFSVHEYGGTYRTIGEALWNNATLSSEQKAALVLAGIKPKVDENSNFWGNHNPHFISSLPFLQYLRADFEFSKRESFETLKTFNPKIREFFTSHGHHLSVLIPGEESRLEVTRDGLEDISRLQLLNRLFWTDLCRSGDFEIYRRNAYRTDDLFISHPVIGREFEEADAEEATGLGGVFIFNNQKWLLGEEELPIDRAIHALTSYEESISTIAEEGNYENLGAILVALVCNSPELASEYGFELNNEAEDWMISVATELAEPDDYDVSAHLNPEFHEVLSWRKLSDKKKRVLFDFLALGLNEPHSKLRNDVIHFLACMALHEDTPSEILEKLRHVNVPLIGEVLASRT